MLTNPVLEYEGKRSVKRVLLLVPVNTLANWEAEFKKWIGDDIPTFRRYYFKETSKHGKAHIVENWYDNGGVLCISYNKFPNAVKEEGPLLTYLQKPGPDRK